MIGQTVLHYEITEKLGEGGMGVVYKARDTHLDRFVAIKVLPPEKVADPSRKARFVQEARAASALNHPNIVTIHDIASDRGHDFIAMEYVAGKTLDQLIPRKGVRLNEALKIAVQIADALACAHAAGIVHRDLKPSNIMVDEHGHVKVLDFGLAKLTEQGISEEDATRTLRAHTGEGRIVGTAAYMSPEQAEARPLDSRSDIFSFGAVLYEMVTGQRAFHGDSTISTMAAVLNKEPRAFPPEVPDSLRRVIGCCLRKDRERRFHHMGDVGIALQEWGDRKGEPSADTAQPSRSRLLVCSLAAALLLAILAAAGWGRYFTARDAQKEPQRGIPFTSYPDLESDPAISPDGNQIAFTWRGEAQDNADIYVRVVGTWMGRPLRLTTDPAPDYSPAFSPNGRMIAFLRDTSEEEAVLYVVPALGGPERRVADIPGLPRARAYEILGRYVTWAPDGKHLIVSSPAVSEPNQGSGLALVAVDTGSVQPLTRPPNALLEKSPAFSPDGKTLAFTRGRTSSSDIYLAPVGADYRVTAEPVRITNQSAWLNGLMWTAEGKEIIFSSGFLVGQALWRIQAKAGVRPRRLNWVGENGFLPTLSRDGARLVYHTYSVNKSIWRRDLAAPGVAAGPPVKLVASSQYDESPAYSPDGRRIAFCSAASGSYEVWTVDADGQNPRSLTNFGKGVVSGVSWSPDGKRVVVSVHASGYADIYAIGADGGGLRRLAGSAFNLYPAYSRDGRWVYYCSNRSGRYEVWKVPPQGGDEVQLTRGGGVRPQESPDGRTLYFLQTGLQAGQSGPLMRVPVEGGDPVQVLDRQTRIHMFQVVAEGIYFVTWPTLDDRTSWQFYRFSDGSVRTVMETGRQNWPFFNISPNGRNILYTDPGTNPGDIMLVENFR